MKRFHSNLDWGSDAKYNDSRKNIRSVSGTIFCELETQKLRLKIKIHPFSISQSAASQLKLLQASTEDYKPAYLGKTEFQYLLWHIDKKLDFQASQNFEAKKKQRHSKNTAQSQQTLLRTMEDSVCCQSIVSLENHWFNTYLCFYFVFKVEFPTFFCGQLINFVSECKYYNKKLQRRQIKCTKFCTKIVIVQKCK